MSSSSLNRRSFLNAASYGVAALWSMQAFGTVRKLPQFSAYPFQLGVASGDPTPDGFVLWTRLAPKPLEGGGMDHEAVEVSWTVAEDEGLTKVVKRGRAVANPEWAHSVHVEVSGLRPDRWYWYQFKAGNDVSQKGRARTFPKRDATVGELRFAFASCQHYESGYYSAYDHMVKEGFDVIVHLGDYIYEGGIGAGEGRPRKHNSKKCFTLDSYRNRYALYKSDEDLKQAHQSAPWIVTPDDHEVENNFADEISEVQFVTRKEFREHRASAYQAYYEHMPLRRGSLPQGPDIQLFRRIPYGRLAEFFVLDTRQYRTDQPCGDRTNTPCDDEMNPEATLLGAGQRDWLFKGLRRSEGAWNVLAQQVMMARVDMRAGPEVTVSHDQWPGYEVDRRRVLKYLHDQKIRNTVVLTGDIHSNWANDLMTNFDRLDSEVVASEFVGTSISSGGDGSKNEARAKTLMSENPFVKYFNAQRGYVSCRVTPKEWRADYRLLDYVSKPGSPIATRASFTVENGRPGVQTT